MEKRPDSRVDHKVFKPLILKLINSPNFQYKNVVLSSKKEDTRTNRRFVSGLVIKNITLNPDRGEVMKRVELEIITKLRNLPLDNFVVEEDSKKIIKSFNWDRPF